MAQGASGRYSAQSADEAVDPRQREFLFTQADFNFLAKLIREQAGIQLTEKKENLVYGRLARRLRELRLESFKQYRQRLSDERLGADELEVFINALTTNLTSFFRENHHFEHLRDAVLRPLVGQNPTGNALGAGKRLRIWSAGCSTGEEPYCIAMCMREAMPNLSAWDARVLATDLDTKVIAHGRAGIYEANRVIGIPPGLFDRYVEQDKVGGKDVYRMSDKLKELIAFKQLNLMAVWPMRGPFDAIFCRNVMIYFDKDTQRKLIKRFADLLRPGGWLYVGHSENISGMDPRLVLQGKTIYRRD